MCTHTHNRNSLKNIFWFYYPFRYFLSRSLVFFSFVARSLLAIASVVPFTVPWNCCILFCLFSSFLISLRLLLPLWALCPSLDLIELFLSLSDGVCCMHLLFFHSFYSIFFCSLQFGTAVSLLFVTEHPETLWSKCEIPTKRWFSSKSLHFSFCPLSFSVFH